MSVLFIACVFPCCVVRLRKKYKRQLYCVKHCSGLFEHPNQPNTETQIEPPIKEVMVFALPIGDDSNKNSHSSCLSNNTQTKIKFCIFFLCSYSGFPVLNVRLFELQDGPRVPTAPSVLRHISPISPAAIFRRSQQVCLSYSNPVKLHPVISLLNPPVVSLILSL